MQIKEFIEKTGFELLNSDADLTREIKGVFVGDLLSWVMGKSEADMVWITVQSHLNIVAVAALKEMSCLIVAQDAEIPEETLLKASEEKLALCKTSLSAYEAAKVCAQLGL